jgi:hypothetical protein
VFAFALESEISGFRAQLTDQHCYVVSVYLGTRRCCGLGRLLLLVGMSTGGAYGVVLVGVQHFLFYAVVLLLSIQSVVTF